MRKFVSEHAVYGALLAAGAVVLGIGVLAAVISSDDGGPQRFGAAASELNVTTITTTYDLDTQYVGKCGIVTPPTPDACDAAQGELRYSFWSAIVNADNFKKWKQSSPGDYQRLLAHMQTPACSVAPVGQVQDMKTALGVALYAEVRAYNCAKGTEPIAMPLPNPPPLAGAQDKTPPSAPGPLNVGP